MCIAWALELAFIRLHSAEWKSRRQELRIGPIWPSLAQPRDPGARGALPGGPPWGPPPGAQMRVFWAQNLVPTSPADSRQNSEFSVHFSWGFAGSEQNYLFIKIPARARFQGYFRPFSGPRCTEKRLFLGVFGGVFHPPAAPEKRGFSAPPGGGWICTTPPRRSGIPSLRHNWAQFTSLSSYTHKSIVSILSPHINM